EEIAYEIDKEIRRIIDECYERARATVTANREALNRIARALLERESLEADELDRLFAGEAAAAVPSEAPTATPQPEPTSPDARARPEAPLPRLRAKPEAS
ncbi:MAG: ATP-dependent zinc metalloprotease FtsH, partial [bacterium]